MEHEFIGESQMGEYESKNEHLLSLALQCHGEPHHK